MFSLYIFALDFTRPEKYCFILFSVFIVELPVTVFFLLCPTADNLARNQFSTGQRVYDVTTRLHTYEYTYNVLTR